MAKKVIVFRIDGTDVEVPEMTWDTIEDVVMPILEDARLRAEAKAENPWWVSRGNDIRILAAAMRRPYDEVRALLSLDEARDVSLRLPELLKISGFTMPGEDQATSGSMGTSTGSSPDSSPEVSHASRSGRTSRGR